MSDRKMKSFAFGSLFVLATSATACGGTPFTEEEQGPDGIDPTTGFSSQGLTIETKTADRVAGKFEREGVVLSFDFTREGTKHTVRLTRADGSPLMESTLVDGVDTMVLLGGRAQIVGAVNEEPSQREGDPAIFDEVASSPEGRLVPPLKEALLAQGVERDLFHPTTGRTSTGGLTPKAGYDGTWWYLAYNESYSFWSWSWWGWTSVVLQNTQDPANGYYKAQFQAWSHGVWYAPETITYYGSHKWSRQWGGALVYVTNKRYSLCHYTGACPYTLQAMNF